MSTDLEVFRLLLDIVDSGGTVAILVLLVVLFVRGDIISATMISRIIHGCVVRVLEELDVKHDSTKRAAK